MAVGHQEGALRSREDLYRSETLWVSSALGHQSDMIVVTFASLSYTDLSEDGVFGAEFLAVCGLDSVHVAGTSNRWYQYPDMGEAIAAVRAVTRGYKQVVTYGLSMGAYAAINFAAALGANRIIAISPQYSVDILKTPFEGRWNHYLEGVTFSCDQIATRPPAPDTEIFIVYDPWDDDRIHVELLTQSMPATLVPVPFGGHPVVGLLIETGVLSRMVHAMLLGVFDMRTFQTTVRDGSIGAFSFLAGFAAALGNRNPQLKLTLLRRVIALQPNLAPVSLAFATALIEAGDYRAALKETAGAQRFAPEEAALFAPLRLEACLALGRIAEAEAEIERQGDARLNDPMFASLASFVFERAGRYDEALSAARGAIRRQPGQPLFHARLSWLSAPPSVRRLTWTLLALPLLSGRDGRRRRLLCRWAQDSTGRARTPPNPARRAAQPLS